VEVCSPRALREGLAELGHQLVAQHEDVLG